MSRFSTPAAAARIRQRKTVDRVFVVLMGIAAFIAVSLLIILLYRIGSSGMRYLGPDLINEFPGRRATGSGARHALFGTLWIMSLTLLFTVPIGVGAAIYLEEFNRRDSWFKRIIQLNIANLSGVPSIIYGMLGLAIFVPFVAVLAGDARSGKTLLAGALTMSLLSLPLVIMVSQEALKAVPSSLRDGSLALGATRWQTIRRVVLPQATPGILTGIILAASRAIGETAPLIVVGAAVMVNSVPTGPFDSYGVLPLQVFNWAQRPQQDFKDLSASTIIVLMGILISLNAIAIIMRMRAQRRA